MRAIAIFAHMRSVWRAGAPPATTMSATGAIDYRQWARPHDTTIDGASSIELMVLDVDYVVENETCVPRELPTVDDDDTSTPCVRIFGVTRAGAHVRAHVYGFLPYFYCDVPEGVPLENECDCEAFKEALRETVVRSMRGYTRGGGNGRRRTSMRECVVYSVKVVRERMRDIDGARPIDVLRISVSEPRFVARLRNALEEGGLARVLVARRQSMVLDDDERRTLDERYTSARTSYALGALRTYESDVQFALRFMIDKDVVGCGWVRLDACVHVERALSRTGWPVDARRHAAQCVVGVTSRNVRPLKECSDIPGGCVRILSFDIECAALKEGAFPTAERDPVIQIANYVWCMGDTEPRWRTLFVLGTCAPIDDATLAVYTFASERKLLAAWARFVRTTDPDVVTGYNIDDFDLAYVVERAVVLGAPLSLGRMGDVARVTTETFSSSAYGTHEWRTVHMAGRVNVDMLRVIQRDHKLRSYKLGAVALKFLDDNKEDVHHSMIPKLYAGSAEDRRRLALYCDKDAALPMRLMRKLMVLYNMVGLARVTGVPLSYIIGRGQQVKVFSQVLRYARRANYLKPHRSERERRELLGDDYEPPRWSAGVPVVEEEEEDADDDGSLFSTVCSGFDAAGHSLKPGVAGARAMAAAAARGKKYEGATVIDPKPGFYDRATPILTLDFASLYPSIMQAHNLCYTTHVRPGDTSVREEDTYVSPTGHRFVKASVRVGILTKLLTELSVARKEAKRAMAEATDPFVRGVYNGRQLALKVSANSVYGTTGALRGSLPSIPVAESVTSVGRTMIEHTKTMLEEHYSRKNGYGADADVIYGDSVAADTPVLCRFANGMIVYRSIDTLGASWESYGHHDKEACVLSDVEVWSDTGFTRVTRVIRHRCGKPMVRVLTCTGAVDVTEDHSLLTPDGASVTSHDVERGTLLMHATLPVGGTDGALRPDEAHAMGLVGAKRCAAIPDEVACASLAARRAFLEGYGDGGGNMCTAGKLGAAGLYFLVASVDSCDHAHDAITQLAPLPPYTGYVYDLETASHHFAAGVGRLVVHNTDSVMVNFGEQSIAEALALGAEAAALVTATFVAPISLEFEKVYAPYLLIAKKRYAGMHWTRADRPNYVDTKGLESVRRDNCLLTAHVIEHVIDTLVRGSDADAAVQYVREVVPDLLRGRIDLSKLVISKEYRRKAADYKCRQIHVELAERMRVRDAATAPRIGSRVPYVIMPAVKAARTFERGEDPTYVLRNGLVPDYRWYLEHQLVKPLTRILTPIIGEERTRTLLAYASWVKRGVVARSSSSSSAPPPRGTIAAHFAPTRMCSQCRKRPAHFSNAMCAPCTRAHTRTDAAYDAQRLACDAARAVSEHAWDICRACQGDNYGRVECVADSCWNYYRREHVRLEYERAADELAHEDAYRRTCTW